MGAHWTCQKCDKQFEEFEYEDYDKHQRSCQIHYLKTVHYLKGYLSRPDATLKGVREAVDRALLHD